MSDAVVTEHRAGGESLEGTRSHELQCDEDVLSPDLQAALDATGTAVGVIATFALLFSQLPHAARLIASVGTETPPKPQPELPHG